MYKTKDALLNRENQNTFRSSLIKVDGFDNAEQFEKFVNDANIKANMLLKAKDPARFEYKYRERTGSKKTFVKQT